MARIRKDENNVTLPVKEEPSPASLLPTAAEQRPKDEDEFSPDTAAKDKESRESVRKKPIGEEEIAEARDRMQRFFSAKKVFDERYSGNFDTYNLLYTEQTNEKVYKDNEGNLHKDLITKRLGAQTLNVILNKHADAMDNYPEPIFLPREKDDEETATMLGSIVPCILERNKYQQTYSDAWTDKLVGGACCVAVTWDSDKEWGIGDIDIHRVNMLSMAWEPFIENIQDSSDVFCVSYLDIESAKRTYPALKDVSSEDLGLSEVKTFYSRSKTENKAAVVDWYYKKDGLLHFCKFCGNQIIFSSENEPEKYPKGYYEHGKYPFVIGVLFPLRDTPVGFSFVDICRAPQEELDSLKHDILKNIKVNSQTRNLVDESTGVNINDLCDLNKEYIKVANLPSGSRVIVPLETKDIAGGALSMYSALTDVIKMTTGTNDASNGASAAGVTSGSAIAALQEAGGKISRDINKGGFREFTEICELVLENVRQFYKPARWFRIIGQDKKTRFVQFDNEGLQPQEFTIEGDDTVFQREPVFDIEVKAQRANPFTTAANNQMMVDMFNMGAFAPQNADAALAMLECMSFEGKDKLVDIVKEKAQLLQTVQELQGRLEMANAMLAQQAADTVEPAMAQAAPEAAPTAAMQPNEPLQLPQHAVEGAKL